MKRTRQSSNTLSVAVNPPADLGCCDNRGVPPQRTTWRKAFNWLTSPAIRVHRYRNIHTQMLRAALCTVDCGTVRHGKDADSE